MQKKARPSINATQPEAQSTEAVPDAVSPADSLDQDALRSISSELEKHFPQPIEETELVLMEISPHRLHAYWHIPPWDLKTASAKTGERKAQLVIRFHDLSADTPQSTPPPTFDIEISKTAGSQYVEVWEDAKRYAAELGLRTKDGLLVDLARSNTVELPRAGHSTSLSAKVMTLTPLEDELYQPPPANQSEFDAISSRKDRTWRTDASQPTDHTLETKLSKLLPSFPSADMALAGGPSRHAPVSETIDVETSKVQPPGISPTVQEMSPDPAEQIAKGPGSTKSFPFTSIEDVQQAPAAGEITSPARLQSLDIATAQPPEAASLPTLGQRPNPTLPPQIASTTPQAGIHHEPGPAPHSSFNLGGEQETLYMELTIRGRKQPNSQFVFYGQSIPTRADGSFSLSLALPASTAKLVAQLIATSQEK